MNKREAEAEFKMYHPDFKKRSKTDQRLLWNDFAERLYQDGYITEDQLYTWDQPKFVK